MSLTRWVLKKENLERTKQLKEEHNMSDLLARILSARGFTDSQLDNMFSGNVIEDPFKLKDMQKAVDRIKTAIENQQKIAIYGDYDCDGVCSCAMLYTYLISIGADVICYIPERNEGYGLSLKGIDSLREQNVDLIITVDNGIVAIDEALYISNCNIDLIVTDHHKVSDLLPKAVAVVNPKRFDDESQFKDICGAVVVLKLIAALEDGDYDTVFDYAGDLAAIATIGDLMPIVSENRTIVARGLRLLNFTENYGLHSLINMISSDHNISSLSVSFGICPRINAAGRFNDAKTAFELLICEDEEKAQELAEKLCEYNIKRKEVEAAITDDVQAYLAANPKELYNPVLVVFNENWMHGVIGIIAGRLMEYYNKPVVVISIDGDVAVGSARSFKGFSMYNALKYCCDCFIKWGGHELAGGVTLNKNKIEDFKKKINEYALKNRPSYREKEIDLVVDPNELSIDLVKDLEKLAPFGNSNRQPLFMIPNLKLLEIIPLSENKHIRLKFMTKSGTIYAIYFQMPPSHFYYKIGNLFNVLVNIDVNIYRDRENINYKIVDIRPAKMKQSNMLASSFEFDRLVQQNKISSAVKKLISPSRNEFLAVYKLIKQLKTFYGDSYKLYTLIYKSSINYCKLCVILDVLSTEGLIKFTPKGISYINNPPKVDLKSNPLIKRLEKNIALK